LKLNIRFYSPSYEPRPMAYTDDALHEAHYVPSITTERGPLYHLHRTEKYELLIEKIRLPRSKWH